MRRSIPLLRAASRSESRDESSSRLPYSGEQVSRSVPYNRVMNGRPQPNEAAPYYFTYIDRVPGENALAVLKANWTNAFSFSRRFRKTNLCTGTPWKKWSIRQVLNHLSDTERAFAFRALWFARGFDAPLPSYDQNIAAAKAEADAIRWDSHVDEFKRVRLATISLFRNFPAEAWMRTGIASGN